MSSPSEDGNLVKIVHQEMDDDYVISATLSRYGGLTVLVMRRKDYQYPWQGENILEARKWCKNNPVRRRVL